MTDLRLALPTHRHGTGTTVPLVLLHAFPVDHRMWDAVVAELPAELTVLVPDLPGMGDTTLEAFGEPSLDTAADAVAATLRAAGVERAVVAGLSMGGYVALALAERHPELVVGLGLVDTKSTLDDEDARANRLRIAATVEAEGTIAAVRGMREAVLGATSIAQRPEIVELVGGWIEDQSAAGVAWSQRAMAARPDRTEILRGFAGPAAVIVGDEDAITRTNAAEHMAAVLADPTFVTVQRAGHLSSVEQPQAVANALVDLVHRVAPSY